MSHPFFIKNIEIVRIIRETLAKLCGINVDNIDHLNRNELYRREV